MRLQRAVPIFHIPTLLRGNRSKIATAQLWEKEEHAGRRAKLFPEQNTPIGQLRNRLRPKILDRAWCALVKLNRVICR